MRARPHSPPSIPPWTSLPAASATARDAAECVADLAELGLVVTGRGTSWSGGSLPVALAREGDRRRGTATDLAAAFGRAAAEARRWGGLPAGALLVVAGLSAPVAPTAGEAWQVRLGRIRAETRFGA